MNENPKSTPIENSAQKSGSQLLGFLAPGGGGLFLSSGQWVQAAGQASPVMAIPISSLFVRHQSRPKHAPESAS